ncbi:hydrolase [bacterium F11]|nr:hydrolase [bacterium F11]
MTIKDHTITLKQYDAILLDLDGVITSTANVHASCWKIMFDEYLKKHAKKEGEPFKAFETGVDYKLYVDGKPRYDGVRSFLKSRNIVLPEGDPNSPPDEESVHGLGNRKNELIRDVVKTEGVVVFDGSVEWIKQLQSLGFKTAVVTSSRNCDLILGAAGLSDLFKTKLDGIVAAKLKIKGKPAPNTYLEAAKMLGASHERSVVVEDAISGVQAGRAGNFGLVIGVDRHGDPQSLKSNGADIVVSSLGELIPFTSKE